MEDNPTEPTKKPETASAKDPGKWWIDESYMDKSVKLSDDFFMYCIGTWWKNTTLDKENSILYRFYDVKPSFTDRVNSLTDDNYSKYKSRLKWAAPNSEAAASAQKLYDDVLPDEMPGVKADGKTTLAENIADLGGTEIAYQAFLNRLKIDGYTGDNLKLMKQRFFLSLGEEWRSKYGADYVNYIAFGKDNPDGPDSHSMSKERVNGVVANMNGWYEAFDIKDGALYRAPADRIKIW